MTFSVLSMGSLIKREAKSILEDTVSLRFSAFLIKCLVLTKTATTTEKPPETLLNVEEDFLSNHTYKSVKTKSTSSILMAAVLLCTIVQSTSSVFGSETLDATVAVLSSTTDGSRSEWIDILGSQGGNLRELMRDIITIYANNEHNSDLRWIETFADYRTWARDHQRDDLSDHVAMLLHFAMRHDSTNAIIFVLRNHGVFDFHWDNVLNNPADIGRSLFLQDGGRLIGTPLFEASRWGGTNVLNFALDHHDSLEILVQEIRDEVFRPLLTGIFLRSWGSQNGCLVTTRWILNHHNDLGLERFENGDNINSTIIDDFEFSHPYHNALEIIGFLYTNKKILKMTTDDLVKYFKLMAGFKEQE